MLIHTAVDYMQNEINVSEKCFTKLQWRLNQFTVSIHYVNVTVNTLTTTKKNSESTVYS